MRNTPFSVFRTSPAGAVTVVAVKAKVVKKTVALFQDDSDEVEKGRDCVRVVRGIAVILVRVVFEGVTCFCSCNVIRHVIV